MAHTRRFSAMLTVGVSLLAMTATIAAPSATAASAPVPLPAKPKGMAAPVAQPAAVDSFASYQPQVSCSPVALPGVVKVRNLALATYKVGRDGGIVRGCGVGGQSEHKEGRSWDWMLNAKNARERAAAGHFISWLTKDGGVQARRLGVMYVIYNHRIWSAYRMGSGWRDYNGAQDHSDHVHLSFTWAGARATTSFWTGKVAGPDFGPCRAFAGQMGQLRKKARTTACPAVAAAPKRSKNPTLYLGASGSQVKTVQRLVGTTVSGRFDARTWKALKRYQRANDLPKTGVVDAATWSAMKPASVSYDAAKGQTAASAAAYARKHYARLTLVKGSAGKPVLFLQIALGMPKAQQNGYFGAKTQAAVQRAQGARGLRRSGVADAGLWSRLGR